MWWKKTFMVIAIVILVALMSLPLGFFGAWSYFSNQLGYLHLNQYWASLISLVFALILVFGAKTYLSFRANRRTIGKITIIGTIILWLIINGLAWQTVNFSADGQPVKWYAKNPDGIRVFDSPGFDPIWNTPLKPITPDILMQIKRQYADTPLFRIDPRNTSKFFDPQTGAPLTYYQRKPNGCLAIFNQPGYDPETGTALLPCTPEIIREIYAQIENPVCQSELNNLFLLGQTPLNFQEFEDYVRHTEKLRPKEK